MQGKTNHKTLYLTVFVCGFVVMAFEIVGSRVLAPFLGTSTYIWVSIIGTILLAMSGGYYYGGRAADKDSNRKQLSAFILLAAGGMCLMNIGKNQLLMFLTSLGLNSLLTSTISAFLLFTFPAFMLAAVFPYVLRVVLTSVDNSGKTAGRLYAISTFGSIAGTFLSATLLIPAFGTTNIIWMLAIVLIVTSLFISFIGNRIKLLVTVLLVISNIVFARIPRDYIDIDTQYSRVWIYDAIAQGREARYLALNGHINGGMWIDNPQLEQLFPYSDYFQLAMHFNQKFQTTLMLGAGGYSLPKLYQEKWPNKALTVVEIDPALTNLGEEHFQFEPSQITSIYHTDARVFLSNSKEKYDIIINDVFTSPFEVPFHMTTLECYQRIAARLNDGGILATNVLGSLDGKHSSFLKSQMRTLESVFDQVLLYQVNNGQKAKIKNNILIAFDGDIDLEKTTASVEMRKMLGNRRSIHVSNEQMILTDDYAPVDWLLSH